MVRYLETSDVAALARVSAVKVRRDVASGALPATAASTRAALWAPDDERLVAYVAEAKRKRTKREEKRASRTERLASREKAA